MTADGPARRTRAAGPASPLLAHGWSGAAVPYPRPALHHGSSLPTGERRLLLPARGFVAPRPWPVRRRCFMPVASPTLQLLPRIRPGGSRRSPPAARRSSPMAGPAPPVPTLCPDSSLAAGQATAIGPHPLPRPWSSPAVVMLTVKLASGVRFSVGEYGKLIFSISFHHRHPAISISSGRRCLRCAFLLRPSHSSAPRPLRSADPGKPAASLPTESLYRCLSPSLPLPLPILAALVQALPACAACQRNRWKETGIHFASTWSTSVQ